LDGLIEQALKQLQLPTNSLTLEQASFVMEFILQQRQEPQKIDQFNKLLREADYMKGGKISKKELLTLVKRIFVKKSIKGIDRDAKIEW
jgi:hypothetical protein